MPNFKISPIRCKYAVLFPIPAACSEELVGFAEHIARFGATITAHLPSLHLVDSAKFFESGDGFYSMSRNGEVLYRDQNHLNKSGSIALFKYLEKALGVGGTH